MPRRLLSQHSRFEINLGEKVKKARNIKKIIEVDTMKKIGTLALIVFMFLVTVSSALALQWDDLTQEQKQNMLSVKRQVTPLESANLPSSTVNPIRIDDPFASAGTPVLVEYTLANVGSEFPFNQIALPPDSFALVISVDKEVGFRTSDGAEIDIFDKMSGLQKFMFLTGLGFEIGVTQLYDTFEGQTCRYVNVYDNLPQSVKDEITIRNDGAPAEVLMWDCLKVMDEEKFEERVDEQCEDQGYSTACLAAINKRATNSITNTVVAALSSDVDQGTCEQVRGATPVSYLSQNVVKCGIGENGLLPGKEVTFRFVIVVPSDTPVLSDEDLARSGEIEQESFTFQASCLKSQFPKNCHTIYAGVYPMATNNVLKVFTQSVTDLFVVGGCGLNKLWFAESTDFEACVEAKSTSIDVVGEPIYEGQGVFFVLAPQLDSRIQLVIIGVAIMGLIGGVLVGRS